MGHMIHKAMDMYKSDNKAQHIAQTFSHLTPTTYPVDR